jgi:cell division septum initiation protein DivIVA
MDGSYGDRGVATNATPQSPPQASSTDGAARLLELAAHNADELLAEAKAEAEQLTSTARAEAERLTSTARAEAERMVGEARTEAERIRAETEKSQGQATQAIAGLRQTERQHRERMQAHLQEMLAKVEANSIG